MWLIGTGNQCRHLKRKAAFPAVVTLCIAGGFLKRGLNVAERKAGKNMEVMALYATTFQTLKREHVKSYHSIPEHYLRAFPLHAINTLSIRILI